MKLGQHPTVTKNAAASCAVREPRNRPLTHTPNHFIKHEHEKQWDTIQCNKALSSGVDIHVGQNNLRREDVVENVKDVNLDFTKDGCNTKWSVFENK